VLFSCHCLQFKFKFSKKSLHTFWDMCCYATFWGAYIQETERRSSNMELLMSNVQCKSTATMSCHSFSMSLITIVLDCNCLISWFPAYYPVTSEEHIFLCDTVYSLASGIAYFLSATHSFNKSLTTFYRMFVWLSLWVYPHNNKAQTVAYFKHT
jgi:hypothetical protein